jgi:hypothetical protein
MNRAALIEMLWADSVLFVPREEFEQLLDGWEITPVYGANGLAGAVVTKEAEFHFAKFDPTYQVTRADLRRWPGELIERYGYALTRTPRHDTRQQRFNERLGFVRVGEDEYDIHYRIERLRVKESACPSQQ